MSSEQFAALRVSTRAMPERERLPFARDVFGRKLCRLDIEPLSGDPFEAEVSMRALPGLRTMVASFSPSRQQRTAALAADGDDSIALPINISGRQTFLNRDREVSLGAGDAVLLVHAEPATMVTSRMRGMGLLVPRAALAPLVRNIEDKAMRLIPRENEALRLLAGYSQHVRDDLALATPEFRRLVVTHVHDLIAMAIGATRDGAALAAERGVRAARLAAIKDDIIEHLDDRDLTLGALAGRHKITPRSIQMLFENEGTTFSQFLIEQRLAYAYRMLGDPRHAGTTINAIALAAGFGDLSHFNRSFRRRFGATPSDVRAALRLAEQRDLCPDL